MQKKGHQLYFLWKLLRKADPLVLTVLSLFMIHNKQLLKFIAQDNNEHTYACWCISIN